MAKNPSPVPCFAGCANGPARVFPLSSLPGTNLKGRCELSHGLFVTASWLHGYVCFPSMRIQLIPKAILRRAFMAAKAGPSSSASRILSALPQISILSSPRKPSSQSEDDGRGKGFPCKLRPCLQKRGRNRPHPVAPQAELALATRGAYPRIGQ